MDNHLPRDVLYAMAMPSIYFSSSFNEVYHLNGSHGEVYRQPLLFLDSVFLNV
jgi:hypothetical protein